MEPILDVKHLQVAFYTDYGVVKAVNNVSFSVYPHETLGLVGESGSGKSVSAMSIMGLIDKPGYQRFWADHKHNIYHPNFVAYVDSLREEGSNGA